MPPQPKPNTPAQEEVLEDDVLARWNVSEGDLTYDLRGYPDGIQMVAIDEDGSEILLAAGLAELDEVIKILHEARAKVVALPAAEQGVPELSDEDFGDEDEEGEEEPS